MPPAVLYHYTDAVGLLGIVRSHILWATDAEFLNDAQELRFGRSELIDALKQAADDPSRSGTDVGPGPDDPGSRPNMMRRVAAELEASDSFPDKVRQGYAAYVACFCEVDDLLSQWRGYGLSGGFAIGFRPAEIRAVSPRKTQDDTDAVREQTEPTPDGPQLVKVSYGVDAIPPVVDAVLQQIRPSGHPGVSTFYQSNAVHAKLAAIKHGAFSEEREWRFIVMPDPGSAAVYFRTGALGVIPYVELPFSQTAICEVVLGPGQDPELRKQGVERLLAQHGFHSARVKLSEAPFRS